MNITNKKLLCFLLLAVTIQCHAQSNVRKVDTLAGSFIRELRHDTKEKIFVQTNKWFYTAGEQLWLKAYIINSLSHKYYSKSKTLYVDLVNDKDTAVAQLLLNIPKQRTDAGISLLTTLPEGYYWLRAYTANMLQHDSSSIFILPIYIINKRFPTVLTEETNNTINTTVNEPPVLSFFPEGGALIEGTNATIGFKAADKEGRPMQVSGTITDSWDKEVTRFKSDSSGQGKFNYFIFKSRQCTAHIKWNGQDFSWPLPKYNLYASQVSVIGEDAYNIEAKVLMGDSIYKKDKPTYLLGVSRDSICFASEGVGMYEINIPKKSFPVGIATLYLFNDKKQVVSERTIYLNKEKEVAQIKMDKDNYKNRDKVTLTITTGDTLLQHGYAALSVSVTDNNVADLPNGLTANPYNQLQVIARPSDNFLLTQPQLYTGRSFSLNLVTDTAVLSYDGDTAITDIKGKILNKKNQPLANRIVTLYSIQQINLFTSTTTDSSGYFKFPLLAYPDSVAFTIQVYNQKGVRQNDKIIVDAFPFPAFTTPASLKKKFSLQQIQEVKSFRANPANDYIIGTGKEWLKEVTVKSKIKKSSDDYNKRASFFSHIMNGEEVQKISVTNTGLALLMIPGVHLSGPYVNIGGPSSMSNKNRGEPLLIVDGVEYPDNTDTTGTDIEQLVKPSSIMRYLDQIPPNIIDFIEVLRGAETAIYGSRGGNGVIIVNTLSSLKMPTVDESIGILKYSPKSYHMAPEFSMPDYNDKRVKESNFNDSRSTLYWNGQVYTNDKGVAVVSFFTSDAASTYTITVSGITVNGDIIYKRASFNRK